MALPGTPGQRISDLCNGNKIKQKELAGVLGKEVSTVSNYIQGVTKPSFDTLIAIADFLEVSLDDLVDRKVVSKEDIDFSKQEIAPHEEEYISLYRSLSKRNQELLLEVAKTFNQNTK